MPWWLWDPQDRANAIEGSKFAVFFVGIMVFFGLLGDALTETPLFIDPKYAEFWTDAEAYHLNLASRKSRDELVQKYDGYVVRFYIEQPQLKAAMLPSEDAAYVNMLIVLISKRTSVLEWTLHLLFVYVPLAFGGYFAQRFVTEKICWTQRAARARAEYYQRLDEKGRKAMVLSFLVTLCLAFVNAMTKITPALDGQGVTLIDLTCGMLFLAYIGGLYMKIVSYAVDAGLLVVGINPHYSYWDEIVAMAVVCPVLYLLFNNSWITILSTVSGGLGAGLLVKRIAVASRQFPVLV